MKIPSIRNILLKILRHPLIYWLVKWGRDHSLPGLQGQSVYEVLIFIIREIQQERLILRANSISFSFFISLFPTIIAFFTLIPVILPFIFNPSLVEWIPMTGFVYTPGGEVDFVETLISQLNSFLPKITGRAEIIQQIREIASQPRTGLFSIGFLLAIYFASNGMLSLMRGFEKSYKDTFRRRRPIVRRLVALGLLVLLTLILSSGLLLIILSKQFMIALIGTEGAGFTNWLAFDFLPFFIVALVTYTGIALVYRYGIFTITRIKFFSTGATLATVGFLLLTLIFGIYINQFSSYNKLYGSIGTIIVLMLWIQLNVLIVLIGFELNASIAVNRDLKKKYVDKE